MASQAWSILALAVVFTTINGSSAARHLLDTTKAEVPESAPATEKPTIPAIPTTLPSIASVPEFTIPTTIPTIPTTLPPISSIAGIPEIPAIPTTLPPISDIPGISSIPITIPQIPGFQVPFVPSTPATSSDP
ncbi:hypothetical protein LUZ63_000362 [Rhynchospora breviuscula]|uniref:Uncharacterized protein n=1 Tax=Rhynchospora breviuscula TaxID=2022672 RepID=A0A9Q0CUS4_9POAL|nr:hypothetical protein LUZ63_000362 [Rhynchospora breviuscula]